MEQRKVLEILSMNPNIYGFHRRWKTLKIPQNINNTDCFLMQPSVTQCA